MEDIHSRADHILWTEWDPIGVRDIGAPRDEYHFYVGDIVKLLERGIMPDDLAAHLLHIEREMMALPGDPARALRVARLLIAARPTA